MLLVDADYQSYATTYYGLYQPDARSLYHVLFAGTAPTDAISVTDYGVDVLRASAALKQAEDQLTHLSTTHTPTCCGSTSTHSRASTTPFKLTALPKATGCWRSSKAMYYLIVPMIPDEFALHSLRIKAENLMQARRTLNPRLQIMGGLIVMQEANATKRAYSEALQGQTVVPFFRTMIRKNITLSRAINAHEPINTYDRRSNGNQDYQALVEEIMGRIAK